MCRSLPQYGRLKNNRKPSMMSPHLVWLFIMHIVNVIVESNRATINAS
jgi:hypothetical protein